MPAISSLFSIVAVVWFSYTSQARTVVWLDLKSNGRSFWSGAWRHNPAHGDTGDCVCIKAVSKKTNKPEVVHCWTKGLHGDDASAQFGGCYRGCENGDANIMDDLNMDMPIDITTFGSDGLWIDRVAAQSGLPAKQSMWARKFSHDPKYWGMQNTAGWCLSKDKNDNSFDKWATVPAGRCFTTLSFKKDRRASGYSDEYGFYRDPALHRRAKAACAAHDRISTWTEKTWSRRMEAGLPEAAPVFEPVGGEAPAVSASVSPQMKALHAAVIKSLVHDRASVDSEEIEEALDDALLALEHQTEREVHDGEVDEVEVTTENMKA